jgi:hypothetical protein
MTDLYGILGLTPRATAAEIKSAYRRLARKYHPDVSASPDANTRFVQINQAYEILSDPNRRWAYDDGQYSDSQRTFYASRQAEVVTKQRHFDRIVDEWMAHQRQENAQRSHAVLVVVPFFLSTFFVMVPPPARLENLHLIAQIGIIGLALYGLIYLVRNLALVLARYTYQVPDHLTSEFTERKAPENKSISRKAGLIFLICGYLVSLGLGYVASNFVGRNSTAFSMSTILCAFLYPSITVLTIGCLRRIITVIERF